MKIRLSEKFIDKNLYIRRIIMEIHTVLENHIEIGVCQVSCRINLI